MTGWIARSAGFYMDRKRVKYLHKKCKLVVDFLKYLHYFIVIKFDERKSSCPMLSSEPEQSGSPVKSENGEAHSGEGILKDSRSIREPALRDRGGRQSRQSEWYRGYFTVSFGRRFFYFKKEGKDENDIRL